MSKQLANTNKILISVIPTLEPPTEPCHINKDKNAFINSSHLFICSLKFSKFLLK